MPSPSTYQEISMRIALALLQDLTDIALGAMWRTAVLAVVFAPAYLVIKWGGV